VTAINRYEPPDATLIYIDFAVLRSFGLRFSFSPNQKEHYTLGRSDYLLIFVLFYYFQTKIMLRIVLFSIYFY
jgi:hypothetical protein